jgi:hypothetical protein
MNLRDALQRQNPSLELQRAAANEIAALDHRIKELEARRGLVDAAAQIERHAGQARHGTDACINVSFSLIFHLGFDRGEKVTGERLAFALAANTAALLTALEADETVQNYIDSVEIIELSDEA